MMKEPRDIPHHDHRYNSFIYVLRCLHTKPYMFVSPWIFYVHIDGLNPLYVHGIFKHTYVYLMGFFIYVYMYSPPIFIYVYIHIYLTHFYTYIFIYIDTYVCFFKALHIDRPRDHNRLQDRQQPANICSV